MAPIGFVSRGCFRAVGANLEADSGICNKCYLDFRQVGLPALENPELKFTVEGYLAFLDAVTPPKSGTCQLATYLAQVDILQTLGRGEMVSLEDGVDKLRKASEEADQHPVSVETLKVYVMETFVGLNETTTDASFVVYDGSDVGNDDRRTKAQYMMPARFDPRFVASLHRRELKTQWEISQVRREAVTLPTATHERPGRSECDTVVAAVAAVTAAGAIMMS